MLSRTTGRFAEVLREGSGIKSTGQRALGSQSAHILRIAGMSHRKKTSRPDLSSRQAGQCVLAQGSDYNRTSFLSIRDGHDPKEDIVFREWRPKEERHSCGRGHDGLFDHTGNNNSPATSP